MDEQLKLFFALPLKEIALRRVTISLWSAPDILASIGTFSLMPGFLQGDYSDRWRETVEIKVTDKVSKLMLPNSLKERMLQVIPSIGLAIKSWKGLHDRNLQIPDWKQMLERHFPDSRAEFDAPILAKLCWTTTGAVDYRKTAEELVRCELLDVVKRYQLACLYCLDDYIPIVWEKVPEEIKRKFFSEFTVRPDMQFCWPFILKGEQYLLDRRTATFHTDYNSFNHLAFHYSARLGNKSANEHFLRKLKQAEKEAAIKRAIFEVIHLSNFTRNIFPLETVSHVLCYLLSQINYEQQVETFKTDPSEILIFFMQWPYQDVFSKNAHLFWVFLPEADYNKMLQIMKRHIKYMKTYFGNFFHEFFKHSPNNFKKLFVDQECLSGFFFHEFFEVQDSESVRAILRNLDAADRFRLLSSKPIFKLFYTWIFIGQTHMVEVCLRESRLSEDDKSRLNVNFVVFLIDDVQLITDDRLIGEQFFQLLYKFDASSQNKRYLVDDTPNKAKKFHSDE